MGLTPAPRHNRRPSEKNMSGKHGSASTTKNDDYRDTGGGYSARPEVATFCSAVLILQRIRRPYQCHS